MMFRHDATIFGLYSVSFAEYKPNYARRQSRFGDSGGVWEYGIMGIWDYGNMGLNSFTVRRPSANG
jgi:hypothetical protein